MLSLSLNGKVPKGKCKFTFNLIDKKLLKVKINIERNDKCIMHTLRKRKYLNLEKYIYITKGKPTN